MHCLHLLCMFMELSITFLNLTAYSNWILIFKNRTTKFWYFYLLYVFMNWFESCWPTDSHNLFWDSCVLFRTNDWFKWLQHHLMLISPLRSIFYILLCTICLLLFALIQVCQQIKQTNGIPLLVIIVVWWVRGNLKSKEKLFLAFLSINESISVHKTINILDFLLE